MIVKTIYCPEIIYSTNYPYFTSNGQVVWILDSQSRVPRFKNTGWLQADSDFDLSLVNQMKIRKSWNLVTQRKLSPCSGSVSQRQLNHGFCPTHIIMGDLIWKFAKILWKNSLRKTSLFVLKYVWPFVTTQHEWVNFLGFIWKNIN